MIMRPTGRTQCCEFANWLGINAGTLGDEALNASTTLERLGSQIRSNTGAMLRGEGRRQSGVPPGSRIGRRCLPPGSGSAKIDGQTGLGVGDPVDGDESSGMAVDTGASGDC